MNKTDLKKGEYGYLDSYKKGKIMVAMVLIVIIAVITTAILLICGTKMNYWIVVPIILTLPFARSIVSYILVRPYSSMSKADYEKVQATFGEEQDAVILYDVTLASEAGMSYMEFAVIVGEKVYGCYSQANKKFKSQDIKAYIEKYLTGYGYTQKNIVMMQDSVDKTLQAAKKELETYRNRDEDKRTAENREALNIKRAILVLGV